jgi:hypothetical protein
MRIETKADILAYIGDHYLELEAVEYLPVDFWHEFEDVLTLAGFVVSQWATPTTAGTRAIEYAYEMLCDMREVDPSLDFETIESFFKAQEVDDDRL